MSACCRIDSRDYRFAFSVIGDTDIPPDFEYRLRAEFVVGTFLPREDTGLLSARPQQPCLLLLFRDHLEIVQHPNAGNRRTTQIALTELDAVESGGALLLGWISFHAKTTVSIRYNRCMREPVQIFLQSVRDLLCVQRLGRSPLSKELALSLKFRNALRAELEPGEGPLAAWYHAALETHPNRWLFGSRHVEPADLLALMPDRLLWVSDRINGSHDRYGSVATYAPLGCIRDIRTRADPSIAVTVASGSQWLIHVPPHRLAEAHRFVRAVEDARCSTGDVRQQLNS